MIRKNLWGGVVAACLMASSAGAVELFVPVPYLGARYQYGTEFVRQDLSKINVNFTYVEDGRSAVGVTPLKYKVLAGPSTDSNHPLLTDDYARDFRRYPARSEPKYYLPGGGLVIMQGENGLVGAETAAVIGGDPTSAWELPMLTAADAYPAGTTVYVLNLMQSSTTASQLSIFGVSNDVAHCQTRLLAADGHLIEERLSLGVPARGSLRVANILSRLTPGNVTGLSVAVSCDRPFYTLGSFPSAKLADVRVHYPSLQPPTLGTRDIFVNNDSFRATQGASDKKYPLPLPEGVRYRSILIDFDVTTAAPPNPAYFRAVLGMWRPVPGLRFGKELYFGTNERFDRSKLLVDLGTPYLEYLVKRGGSALLSGKTYHFHIEVNSDQHSIRQLVTNASGGVVSDIISGLFNDDLVNRQGNAPIVGFGLEGIADGAYSPPYGWRFAKIVISGYR
jgi:hypothetical protein